MSDCNHKCGSCSSENCADRKADMKVAPHKFSSVKKVIGVVSGKGGVGKSLVTGLLASKMQSRGFHAGVLDADITGPSIPRLFGLTQRMHGTQLGLNPVRSATGVDVASMNLLLDDPTQPVIWRGPVIAQVVTQFWSEVIWNNVDYLFVDMPPGTGDVPLTVYQSLPVDGIVIVTSPQDLVSMIVSKAVKMANMMHVPVLGFVENYSYLECPDCGKKINVFGESRLDEVAEAFGLPILARLPIDPKVAESYDSGKMEDVDTSKVDGVIAAVEKV